MALQTAGRNAGSARLVYAAEDEVFPVCSPHYLKGREPPLVLSQLCHHNLLPHKIEPQDWINWDSWLAQTGAGFRVGYAGEAYDSYPMMIQATLEGHGIALGWSRTVEGYLAAGALVRPFAEQLSLPDGLCIYQPAGLPLRTDTAVLLEWLKSELS